MNYTDKVQQSLKVKSKAAKLKIKKKKHHLRQIAYRKRIIDAKAFQCIADKCGQCFYDNRMLANHVLKCPEVRDGGIGSKAIFEEAVELKMNQLAAHQKYREGKGNNWRGYKGLTRGRKRNIEHKCPCGLSFDSAKQKLNHKRSCKEAKPNV